MTTLTFILVIGVIWSVTSKRKREDILGGFWETDQLGALHAERFNRRGNDLKSHRPRRPLSLRGRNYSGSERRFVARPGEQNAPPVVS